MDLTIVNHGTLHLHFPPRGGDEAIIERLTAMALDISALTAAVAASTTVDESASVLIRQIAAQIANTVDPVELQALADQLTASTTQLSAAVLENTPAA